MLIVLKLKSESAIFYHSLLDVRRSTSPSMQRYVHRQGSVSLSGDLNSVAPAVNPAIVTMMPQQLGLMGTTYSFTLLYELLYGLAFCKFIQPIKYCNEVSLNSKAWKPWKLQLITGKMPSKP